jgi:hypothetical protein
LPKFCVGRRATGPEWLDFSFLARRTYSSNLSHTPGQTIQNGAVRYIVKKKEKKKGLAL